MRAILIINLLFLIVQVRTASFFYTEGSRSTSAYQCFKEETGKDRIVLLIGANISRDSIQNIGNAKSAGLGVEAIYLPCRNRTVDFHIQVLGMVFPLKTIDRYWLLPSQGPSSSCGWSNYPPD